MYVTSGAYFTHVDPNLLLAKLGRGTSEGRCAAWKQGRTAYDDLAEAQAIVLVRESRSTLRGFTRRTPTQ